MWLGDQAISVHNRWPIRSGTLNIYQLKPKPRPKEHYKKLCGGGEKAAFYERWLCHPQDRAQYRRFVQYLFRVANSSIEKEYTCAPFCAGMGDGIDVRATLRAIHSDEIWIRERSTPPPQYTNAAIDWHFESEFCEELQHDGENGWIDPSEYYDLGSVSFETSQASVIHKNPHVQLDRRDWTLLTLDLGTSTGVKDKPAFYDKVIFPLVCLPGTGGVYQWLEVMFQFCAGKPFAYFSRYVPSRKMYRLARRHHVHLQHFPLQILPESYRERSRYFRFMEVTREKFRRISYLEYMLQRKKMND